MIKENIAANKAEVEKDAARYQFLRHADLDEMARVYWTEGEVPSGAEFDATIDHAMGVATPPATTGASTAELKALQSRVCELEAARIAYANEFPLTEDGDPDVGNIHANIRALKAKVGASTVLTDERIDALQDAANLAWSFGKDKVHAILRTIIEDHKVAAQAGQVAVPDDPMDSDLPCDIKVGNVTIRKGCKLRTLVARMESLHRMAMAALPVVTPEQRAEFDSMFPRFASVSAAPSPAKESK